MIGKILASQLLCQLCRIERLCTKFSKYIYITVARETKGDLVYTNGKIV